MWKSRHFFDWVSVAATELPLSKPAINKKNIAWNPSPNMELVAALDLMQGPESITEICRLQPAQIDSKVILTRWSTDVKAHLSRMRRRSIGTGTWPCHSRLSLRFANVWQILSPFMTFYDNHTAIYDMMICYVMLMTCLYDKFMTHFGVVFELLSLPLLAFKIPALNSPSTKRWSSLPRP